MTENLAVPDSLKNSLRTDIFEQRLSEVFDRFHLKVRVKGAYIRADPKTYIVTGDLLGITLAEGEFIDLRISDMKILPFIRAVQDAFIFSFTDPYSLTLADLYYGNDTMVEVFTSLSQEINRGDMIRNIIASFVMEVNHFLIARKRNLK